ncbi:MAG: dihydroorotate dehydrogenase [Actinomycetota bacterium]|nr:dihydroorotate dehydrogenase [Actinomycetota bacterium]
MADLTTTVGGFVAANPVWVGSSELTMSWRGIVACAEAGAGAVVAKSINETQAARDQLAIADYAWIGPDRRPGSPAREASLLNRSGLAQATLEEWVAMLNSAEARAQAAGSAVIGSITVASPEGAAQIAGRLWSVVEAVELNVGAPHGREAPTGAVRQLTEADAVRQTVDTVRRVSDQPLLVKLPGTASDIGELARAAADAGADAVTMMGRFNGFLPDVDTYQPVLGSWGAIGGPWCLPLSLFAISKAFRDPALDVPLVGTNGARSVDDVIRFLISGASAVEVVDLVWQEGPSVLRALIGGVREHLAERGEASVSSIVGAAAVRSRTYAEIPPADHPPQPWLDRIPPAP